MRHPGFEANIRWADATTKTDQTTHLFFKRTEEYINMIRKVKF